MAGGDKDHVKTRVLETEQTLLPNLKILISVVGGHSSSISRTCVGGMGRVEIPTKYNISHVVWRGGWLWILWSPRRGGKNKKNNKKTERGGQEM